MPAQAHLHNVQRQNHRGAACVCTYVYNVHINVHMVCVRVHVGGGWRDLSMINVCAYIHVEVHVIRRKPCSATDDWGVGGGRGVSMGGVS